MIRICSFLENGKIKKVTFVGHAGYADYGKDIVCAAVSSTLLCTVNAILRLKLDSIRIVDNDDFVLEVVSFDDVTVGLIDNMMWCLESLEKQYPRNIKLSKEEE